jgi:hypothetical protein
VAELGPGDIMQSEYRPYYEILPSRSLRALCKLLVAELGPDDIMQSEYRHYYEILPSRSLRAFRVNSHREPSECQTDHLGIFILEVLPCRPAWSPTLDIDFVNQHYHLLVKPLSL